MDTDQLIERFNELFAAHADFAKINRTHDVLRFLQQECRRIEQVPEMLPLLGPIGNESQATLKTGLFCGWFSLCIARHLRAPESTLRFAFLAGLVQDIGLLRNRSDTPAPLPQTGAGLRAYERHPLVSCRILEQVPGIPTEIIAAVREHHEMPDGSGFPIGLLGSEGSGVGRILSTSNAFWTYRMRRPGFTLGHIVPLCLFAHSQSFTPECRAGLELIRESNLTASRRFDDTEIPEVIARLLGRSELLKQWHVAAREVGESLQHNRSPETGRICRLIDRIDRGVESSGILNDAMMRWATHVIATSHATAFGEMEELEALHSELNAQLHLVNCMLESEVIEPETATEELTERIGKMKDLESALPASYGYTTEVEPQGGSQKEIVIG